MTKQQLIDDLRRLGLEAGDLVMFHSSYKAIGPVEGGPATVIEALREAVGESGTIMAYASWELSTYDSTLNGRDMAPRERDRWPAFDPAVSKAYVKWGILLEFLCTTPGAKRSNHPDVSCVALGRQADTLTADHPAVQGYGPGTPFAKLCDFGGKVLLLGAPLDCVTLIHHAEVLAELPNKRMVSYQAPVLEDGRRVWREFEEFDTTDGVLAAFDSMEPNYLEQIAGAYVGAGFGTAGRVGSAPCHLFNAAHLVRFTVDWLETRFGAGG